MRQEFDRLTQPSARWSGGVVIPIDALRCVPASARREVAAAIARAVDTPR